jgi:hypothetical protein
MRRGRPLQRRSPLRRGKPLRARPAGRAREQAAERRRNMIEAFGVKPDCAGWKLIPACPRDPHPADVPHEPGMRSHGADPTDPEQAIPLCADGHEWVHANPAHARRICAPDGRAFLR